MSDKFAWIHKINYKDIIIIYAIWFFALFFNRFFHFAAFMEVPDLSGFFDLLFNFAARFIFISLFFLYFIFIYGLSFKELGISFKSSFKKIIPLIIYIAVLLSLVLAFINIPLAENNISQSFHPVYNIYDTQSFVQSLLPFLMLFPLFFIIALSEQLMLNLFVYEIFKIKLPKLISRFLSAIFFSFLIYRLQPDKIIIFFSFALISILLYERTEKSILAPAFFGAGFYLIYTLYIYGWNFI